MSADWLERIEQAAWRVARRRFDEETLRPSVLGRAALELSRLYTTDRQLPAAAAAGAGAIEQLAARLLFFTPSEVPKWLSPLAELESAGFAPESTLDVLDLGAGCGAATLGLLLARAPSGRARIRVHALDRDGAGLELLADVLDELTADGDAPVVELSTSCQDVARPLPAEPARCQLVLIGNLLNELDAPRALELVRESLTRVAPGGGLVIIEPALRETSRALQQLRDSLLEQGAARVLAPCTRTGPCPALADPDDWCHQCQPWTLPPMLRELSSQTGLRRRELRYSYLCLAPALDGAAPPNRGGWRVVSEPLVSKGKRELFVCGEAGRWRAVLLNRHRSPTNEPFRRLRRGELCQIDGASFRGAELRLSPESRVVNQTGSGVP